jgi:chromosomal replication initiation ATPase DnaA
VLGFIASNVRDNIRELEGALIRVAAYSSLNRAALSEEVARTVLADLLPATKPRGSPRISSSRRPPRCSASPSTSSAGRAAAGRS